jgi:PAS domain S-box-containing protein
MYEYMNLACEQAYGEPRAHFIGRTLHDVWPKHVADRIESQFGACRQSGSPFPFTVETVVNGALRYRDGTLSPLDQNPETGNADRILICTWDVTHKILLERQVAEQHAAIAQSDANARLILDTSKDMVSRVAADGTRLYASAATQRIFGISQQDFMQMHYAAVIHPDDLPVVRDVQTRVLAGELAETTFAYRIRHPERGERWLESDVVAVSDSGGGYISITRDITERVALDMERHKHTTELRLANAELERLARHMGKARKAAEQASRAKTRFLAGMSHELRTPLNGILGYAQLLRMDGQLTPSQAVRVQAMQSAGNHLLEMISCVLDLSEIETEGATLELASFDLPAVVEACMDIVRPAAEAKGLALRLGLGSDLPRHVVSSMTRLRQVLLNLLGNAVKYTPAGAVDLRVLVAAGNSGTPRLRLEVADTGPGIPPAKRDLLFEEFERLGARPAARPKAPGLVFLWRNASPRCWAARLAITTMPAAAACSSSICRW